MKHHPDTFALGVKNAIEIGIPKWSESFCLRVSHQEFYDIYKTIWKEYLDQLHSQPEAVAAALKIRVKMVMYFSLMIQFDLERSRSEKAHLAPADPNEFSDIQSSLCTIFDTDLERAKKTLQPTPLKSFLRSLFHCIWRRPLEAFNLIQKLSYNIGPPDQLKDGYIASRSLGDWKRLPSDFISLRSVNIDQSEHEPAAIAAAEKFCAKIFSLIEPLSGAISENTKHSLEQSMKVNIAFYASAYRVAKRKLSRFRHKNLIASSIANPVNRCLLIANSAAGKHSIGVTHGNNIGISLYPLVFWQELSSADELIFPHKKAADEIEKVIKREPELMALGTKVSHVELNYFKDLIPKIPRARQKETVKTVMVIGFPFNDLRYPDLACGSSLVQLDLEYRVLRALSKKFKVIYKAHPERLKEIQNGAIWANLVDSVEIEPFENVMEHADAFVFPQISSTTFFVALLSEKPVIYFDPGIEYFLPDAKVSLNQRATALPSRFLASGRLDFNEDELIEALRNPRDPSNSTFRENYILT